MGDGTVPKKSLGQHWLTDAASLLAMCEAAVLSKNDTVVEIGPGLGTLTHLLVEQAGHVIAVELDDTLATELPHRVPADNLEVVHGDILKFNLSSLPEGYKVVANIPYYLTSNLIRVLSEAENPPERAVLLMQKEVAQRVTAEPNNMSQLAVTAQYFWEATLDRIVSARLFTPPPKVDSQILVLIRRQEPLFPDVDPKQFFRLSKAGFSQRRKTLLNSLSAGLQRSRETTNELLQLSGIDPTARAQDLSLGQWYSIYKNA